VKLINLESTSTHWNEKELLLDRTNKYLVNKVNVTAFPEIIDTNKLFLVKHVYGIILELRKIKDIYDLDSLIQEYMKKYGWTENYIHNTIKFMI
jgi:hypothetical protein